MPSPKKKEIVINSKINDVLKHVFNNNIQTLSLKKIESLYNDGSISSTVYKFLKDVVKYQGKEKEGKIEIKYTYDIQEKPKLTITLKLNEILTEHFEGEIKKIRASTLKKLLKDKHITKEEEKELIKLKKAQVKGILDEVVEYEKPIEDFEEEGEDGGLEPEPDFDNYEVDPNALKDTAWEKHPKVLEIDEKNKDDKDGDDKDGDDKDEGDKDEGDKDEGDKDGDDKDEDDKDGDDKDGDDKDGDDKDDKLSINIKEGKYLIPHRKAFVEFVNDEFYKSILRKTNDSELNVYQVLVREYLSIETPYRGLLVYHGLGTGKTATAVSMAEKASSDMKITTLLPASLESNFIGEVKRWGKNELDIEGSNWSFISFKKIQEDDQIRKGLYDTYGVTDEVLKNIINHTIREVKQKIKKMLIDGDHELQNKKPVLFNKMKQEYKKVSGDVLQMKGFWKHGSTGEKYADMSEYQKIFLECQIHKLIELKYNFIHYNPLPTIKKSDTERQDSDDEDIFEDELIQQGNALIKQNLIQKLNHNISKYEVESPFYGETVIIDEVHNFVREVVNNSGSARTFYEWIINAEKVKLVFLSGTPIINKPSEIAILYNMLKGKQYVYTLTIKSNEEPRDITEKLNGIIYTDKSPIELFHVSRKEGKLVISFTMNQESFVSVMNPENKLVYTSAENKYTYKQFIKNIYAGLEKVFDKSDITPDAKKASGSYKKPIVFDKQLNIPFYRSQNLFEIKDKGELRDLSNDENFMDYFFLDNFEIDDQKKTLLRRMLMGLTSYYPIDRSQIGSMPTVVAPQITQGYENYTITEKMTVESCQMSSLQFNKYIEVWRSEKKKDLIRQMKRHLHEELPFDFNIRTRQICNMIYKDDEFRYIKDDDRAYGKKIEQYEDLKQNKLLDYENKLSEFSPKLYRIMKNILKFRDGIKPTGKVLIYSDFRGDAGGEIVEHVLRANGYSLYNPTEPTSNSLKFTFITGQEGVDQRKQNMQAFNDPSNKYGEHIQIMIISGAGAEGISLTCVRQVHILEPFWNFVRIDQVFGRAIRLKSHDELDPKDRNVEEYVYLSTLPSGTSIEEIYQSIQDWDSIPELSDVKSEIAEGQHKDIKEIIDMIQNIGQSVDQKIFDIMEKKYKVSKNIIDIIKESSLDCIQHTRDDPGINEKCIRFSNLLMHEIAYFPGISSEELFEIDVKQLKASFLLFMKPDIYVVGSGDDYIYYESDKEGLDIRYIRENTKKICSLSLVHGHIYFNVEKDHDLNDELGKQFSVYQDMYSLNKYYDEIVDKKFPSVKTIQNDEKLGFKIKYNPNEMMFFSPNEEDKLRRLYRFDEFIEKKMVKPLILCNKDVFIQD
jgi:hypothetical protein